MCVHHGDRRCKRSISVRSIPDVSPTANSSTAAPLMTIEAGRWPPAAGSALRFTQRIKRCSISSILCLSGWAASDRPDAVRNNYHLRMKLKTVSNVVRSEIAICNLADRFKRWSNKLAISKLIQLDEKFNEGIDTSQPEDELDIAFDTVKSINKSNGSELGNE